MATDYSGAIGAMLRRKHYDARNIAKRHRYATDPEWRESLLRNKREWYARKRDAARSHQA